MHQPRYLYAALACALLFCASSASAGSRTIVDGNAETTAAPTVEIVVYDGTQLPAQVVAGCSEENCLGWTGPVSGTVTHAKNYVGWGVGDGDPRGRIFLYVDGQYVTSARPGRLIVWSAGNLAPGPHTVEAMAKNYAGVEGWSNPLVIEIVK